MYFEIDESHPDISPVGSVMSWREGVLLSIIVHLIFVIIGLKAPQFFEMDAEERAAYDEAYAPILRGFKAKTDAEHDEVVARGGLYVLGTERHESRRIDNQLRGRSGRQGDPGSSRFFLSLEDDLLRIFGAERRAPIPSVEVEDRRNERQPHLHLIVTAHIQPIVQLQVDRRPRRVDVLEVAVPLRIGLRSHLDGRPAEDLEGRRGSPGGRHDELEIWRPGFVAGDRVEHPLA